jgi:hypothetical protein
VPTENIEIGDMSQHMHTPTWEHLIKIIDTVDQVDKHLVIHFTLYVSPLSFFCSLRWIS